MTFSHSVSCSLLYWILTHTMSPSPWACPVNVNWSGLQMQAWENSTTQSFMNCCFSSITLARSLWFDCRTSPTPPACWFLKCFLSIVQQSPYVSSDFCSVLLVCWLLYWFFFFNYLIPWFYQILCESISSCMAPWIFSLFGLVLSLTSVSHLWL